MFDFLADYLFTKEEQPTMANFNARLEMLNALKNHWWKRRVKGKVTSKGSNAAPLSVIEVNGVNDQYSIEYSYETKVDPSTNNISLVDPKFVSVSFNTASNANVLKGAYFRTYSVKTGLSPSFFYVDLDAPDAEAGAGTYYSVSFNTKAYNVIVVDGYTDWEYIQSSDRSAYPDSGEQDGYEYQYLGVPFENAVGAPKIETGSYIGTGTYGRDNPNILTFGFEPKLVIIFGSNSAGILQCVDNSISPSFTNLSYSSNVSGSYRTGVLCRYTQNTLTWYSSYGAQYQLNAAGRYTYIALG